MDHFVRFHVRFHKNELDEFFCKLDSTEDARSFEQMSTLPYACLSLICFMSFIRFQTARGGQTLFQV